MNHKELYSGLVRLHLLYHASKEPIFGLEMIVELGRHGYALSPGTLYPILHRMEEKGYMRSHQTQVNGKIRRVYEITRAGRTALKDARRKVKELFGELFEES